VRAVDTNILVRLLARDEPRQLAAAERFVAGGAWVSHLVLVETTWVLDAVYARTGEQIAVAIAMLLDHEQLTVQDENAVRLALEHYQRKPALGFSDCLLLEIARQAGHLPLVTFDRQLGQLPGAQRL
jgi:predicted nucleic-acid-binding protein